MDRSAELMLPETEKKALIKGYKGIKKYLYAGFSEIRELLFFSSKMFALMHENLTALQFEKRVKRIKIIKVLSIVIPFAVLLPAAFYSPVAACILFLPLVFITAGIAHSVNNYIEGGIVFLKPFGFSVYSKAELNERILFYSYPLADMEKGSKADAGKMLKHSKEIELLLSRPELFTDGPVLKHKVQILMEKVYHNLLKHKNGKKADSFFNFLYSVSEAVYSNGLQKYIIEYIKEDIPKRDKDSNVNKQYFGLLKAFALSNGNILDSGPVLGEEDFAGRIQNLRETFTAVLMVFLKTDRYDSLGFSSEFIRETAVNKKYGIYASQIYIDWHILTYRSVPQDFADKYINLEGSDRIDLLCVVASGIGKFLQQSQSSIYMRPETGYLYINAATLYDAYEVAKNARLCAPYRIYAFGRIAAGSFSGEDIKDFADKSGKHIYGTTLSYSDIFNEAFAQELSVLGTRFLDDTASGKVNTAKTDDYFAAREAETLLAAAVLEAGKDITIIEYIMCSLKNVFCVLYKENKAVFIIKNKTSGKYEIISIAADNAQEYIKSIRKLAAEILIAPDGENLRFTTETVLIPLDNTEEYLRTIKYVADRVLRGVKLEAKLKEKQKTLRKKDKENK